MKQYQLYLEEELSRDLTGLSWLLGISEGDVLVRAINLFKAAVDADTVILTKKGEEKKVLIK